MARSKKSAKGKKKSVSVDFAGVEAGGRSIEDGWAHAEILEAELTTSSNDNQMFSIKLQYTRGKEKAIGYDQLVLTPNALWKLKGLLEAAGVEVPDGEMDIEEKDLVGLEFEAEIVNENFEGKDRPKPVSFRPVGDDDEEDEEEEDDDSDDEDDEEEDDEEEEEAPKSKKKSSKKSKSKDEDEDDDDSDDDEEDDDSDDDDEDDEDDDDDEEEEDEEDDDDDEEEDDEPKSKKKGKSKSKLRAGMKVSFTDDKDKVRKGVITSIDDDTIFVEDSKGDEWELSAAEITVSK